MVLTTDRRLNEANKMLYEWAEEQPDHRRYDPQWMMIEGVHTEEEWTQGRPNVRW